MAYVLGFWFADGYMKHMRSYRILFYSKDRQILQDLAEALSTNMPIRGEYGNKEGDCLHLVTHSKQMYTDLLKLGGRRRKSRVLKFPEVPGMFLADFVRGYFDGDGSVHEVTYKATKNGLIYTQIRSNFTCGSMRFLVVLRGLLSKRLGLTMRVIGKYGPYQYKLGYGEQDTHQLLEFMYYPSHKLSLKRKVKYLSKVRKKVKNYAFVSKFQTVS